MNLHVLEQEEVNPSVTRDINFKIVSDPDWSRGEYHQAILNAYYDLWQREKFRDYSHMIAAAVARNPLHGFAILIGRCDQQICNGGGSQYYGNGYASIGNVYQFKTEDDIDIDLHEDLLTLWDHYISPFYNEYPNLEAIRSVLGRFCVWVVDYDEIHSECEYCGGEGYIEHCSGCDCTLDSCECEDPGEDVDSVKVDCEECFECEEYNSTFYGRFVVETSEEYIVADFNDDEYYRVNTGLLDFLNQWFYGQLYWELVRPNFRAA